MKHDNASVKLEGCVTFPVTLQYQDFITTDEK